MDLETGRDKFLSDEDLDLGTLPEEEWLAWWNRWLQIAQATNDDDRDLYTHGVFRRFPPGAPDAP